MENKKIYQQIPKAIQAIGAIGKNGNNSHQNYKFRSIDDMYNKIQPVLPDLGLFFVPTVLESKEEHFETQKGAKSIRVKQRVKYDIFAEDGSSVVSIVEGEAVDTSDKATNKAMTAAFKYMLIQVFCIAIEGLDDADKETPDLGAAKGTDPAEYVVKIGKQYKGMMLKDMKPFEIDGYAKWLSGKLKEDKKKADKLTQEFFDNASAYLDSINYEAPPDKPAKGKKPQDPPELNTNETIN